MCKRDRIFTIPSQIVDCDDENNNVGYKLNNRKIPNC